MEELTKSIQQILQRLDKIETKLENCATKDDLKGFATKDDLENLKVDVLDRVENIERNFATKDDLEKLKVDVLDRVNNIERNFATKIDFENLRLELLDKMFAFEHDYGEKISSIYDAVALEYDKNAEKAKEIKKLDTRVTRAEAKLFSQEKRISVLEMKQN